MIERHYGKLLDGAMESIATRLDALDRERVHARDGSDRGDFSPCERVSLSRSIRPEGGSTE
jgi:hypothetical protein